MALLVSIPAPNVNKVDLTPSKSRVRFLTEGNCLAVSLVDIVRVLKLQSNCSSFNQFATMCYRQNLGGTYKVGLPPERYELAKQESLAQDSAYNPAAPRWFGANCWLNGEADHPNFFHPVIADLFFNVLEQHGRLLNPALKKWWFNTFLPVLNASRHQDKAEEFALDNGLEHAQVFTNQLVLVESDEYETWSYRFKVVDAKTYIARAKECRIPFKKISYCLDPKEISDYFWHSMTPTHRAQLLKDGTTLQAVREARKAAKTAKAKAAKARILKGPLKCQWPIDKPRANKPDKAQSQHLALADWNETRKCAKASLKQLRDCVSTINKAAKAQMSLGELRKEKTQAEASLKATRARNRADTLRILGEAEARKHRSESNTSLWDDAKL